MIKIFSKTRADASHDEKMVRLEQAERDLASLKERLSQPMAVLDKRRRQNHWRESIEQMIQGGI